MDLGAFSTDRFSTGIESILVPSPSVPAHRTEPTVHIIGTEAAYEAFASRHPQLRVEHNTYPSWSVPIDLVAYTESEAWERLCTWYNERTREPEQPRRATGNPLAALQAMIDARY